MRTLKLWRVWCGVP